jgi:hypothetical protein
MSQPNYPSPIPQPPKSKRGWPWIVAGAVVTLLVIGVVTEIYETPPPPKPTGPATTIETGGIYVVGEDIQPGTYKTAGGDRRRCYWARLRDTSGDRGTILANDLAEGPMTVTIKTTDGAFKTSGCQTWTLDK